jgi:hypothetical protein
VSGSGGVVVVGGRGGVVVDDAKGPKAHLHDRLSHTIRRCHKNDIAETRFCVEREDDAGCSQVGPHHLLHARRQCDIAVTEVLVNTVSDSPVCVAEKGNERMWTE